MKHKQMYFLSCHDSVGQISIFIFKDFLSMLA